MHELAPARLNRAVPDLERILPGLLVTTVVRRTAKSVVLFGNHERRPVAIKVLLEQAPEWTARFNHEVDIYRTFGKHPPPTRTPALIHADKRSKVLVLERIDDPPLAEERYPGPLAPVGVTAALETLHALNGWTPPPGPAAAAGFDYAARIESAVRQSLIRPGDGDRLRILLDRQPAGKQEFCHGDALLSNFMVADRQCVLLDWEFAGLYLPGFDLALLWTVLRDTPIGRHQIETVIGAGGDTRREAFVINLAVVLAREIRIHRELTPTPERDRILQGLGAEMADIRVLLSAAVW